MKEKYLKKAFEIFLLFYITFIPLVFFGHANDPFWVVEKFFFRFAISILSCIFLLYMFATKKIFYIKTPYNFLFLAFMCINLIGILKISNFYAFMDRFFENICYLITAYLALLYLLTNRPADKTNEILLLLVSAAGFMAIYGIAQSFGIDFLSWQTNFSNRAASTLGNPNFLAGHMVLIIPLCYAMIFIVQNRVLRFAMLLISVITTTALLFTQTRGAYIGFGVSTIFFLLLLALYARDTLQKYKTWIIVFCCIAAGIVGAYLVKNHNALARIKEIVTLKDESVRIRALLWKNSLYLISENPLLGSGAGNFYAKYPYYQSRALDYTYFTNNDFYRSGHSHNDFIQFAAEYGIPGAGIMFAIFALIFITGFKHLKDSGQNKMLIMGMLSGIAGLLIHAIFNFPFQIIPTTVVFYLFLSMLVFNEKEFSSREPAINGAARIAGAVLLVIFITAGVIAVRALASDSYLRSAKEADYFKQPENAAGYAARAISITPWNEDELYFYGQVLEKQGKKQRLTKVMNRFTKLTSHTGRQCRGFFNIIWSRA